MKQQPQKKTSSTAKDGDHRHRMTEQEEDEELMTDLNQSKKSVVSFDESPHYIKNGKLRDYQVKYSKRIKLNEIKVIKYHAFLNSRFED